MRTLPFLIATCLVSACTMGPDFERPAAPPPQSGYSSDGAGKAELAQGPEQTWWKSFGSTELDGLVDRALAANHSLAASRATLERARERIRAVAGKRLPQVDANARADYEQVNLSAFGLGSTFNLGNPEFDLYTLGAGVTYDLDLFGRNRRALEQATADAEAQQRQTEAAHLVIAGRVVLQVLSIAALNDRIATERALIAEAEQNVSLTERRQRAGVGTMVEVLSAQGQAASDRAGLPQLEQQRAEARNMLAVLLGISPAELGATDYTLDQFTLPGRVPVTMASELVHKRPDILEAEARLHSATAAIGVAEANLYPNVTLGASMTQSTSQPGSIFSGNYNAFDLFSGVTAPIFHGGTLHAEKRGAEAGARAAAENYQQVVLDAFGQVSNLLSSLETDGKALTTQREAANVAERSLHLSRRSFQVGNSGILQVLDASRSNQRAKLNLLEVRTRQYLNVARLHVATAGGWLQDGEAVASVKSE